MFLNKVVLPKITDQRGSLSYFESNTHIPFKIKSVSIISDLRTFFKNESGKKNTKDIFLLVLTGSLDVIVNNGRVEETIKLRKPNVGLYISSDAQVVYGNFSLETILLKLNP